MWGWFSREGDEGRKVVGNIYVGGRTRVDYRATEGEEKDYRGVVRAWCPVFIALANRSITDSDTAQLGNPRVEASPRMSTPLSRSFAVPANPFRFSSVLPPLARLSVPFSSCLFISSLNLIFASTRNVNVLIIYIVSSTFYIWFCFFSRLFIGNFIDIFVNINYVFMYCIFFNIV